MYDTDKGNHNSTNEEKLGRGDGVAAYLLIMGDSHYRIEWSADTTRDYHLDQLPDVCVDFEADVGSSLLS